MQIWIDNTQLQDITNLDDALEHARLHAEGSGRLIVDILVDGNPATDAFFDSEPGDHPPIKELRFTTAHTQSLVAETIDTAIESIELLRADQIAGAKQLREGELDDAMETLRAIMKGWQAMRDIVDQITQITNLDIATLKAGDHLGSEIVEMFVKTLSEVRETLQSEDWSSLGDVIEYDLEELAAKWTPLLSALKTSTASA